jgi:hypothetical protein
LGFQASKKISDSFLENKWPKNDTYAKDDPYETPTFTYNRETDQLMVANTINNEVEKENILGLNDEDEMGGQKQHTRKIP